VERKPEVERLSEKLDLILPVLANRHENVTSSDGIYLEYFISTKYFSRYTSMTVKDELVGSTIIPSERTALILSSPTMRAVAMAFASFQKTGVQQDTIRYLGRCYKEIQSALSATPSVDLAYACFTLFLLSDYMDEPLSTISNHAFGFLEILNCLKKATTFVTEEWEWHWMEGLLYESAHRVLLKLNRDLVFIDPLLFATRIKKMCQMFEAINGPFSTSQRLEEAERQMTRLKIYINYYFTYYLLLLNNVCGCPKSDTKLEKKVVATKLANLLKQFIDLLHMHDGRLVDILARLRHLDRASPTRPALFSLEINRVCDYISAKLISKILRFIESGEDTSYSAFSEFSVYQIAIPLLNPNWWVISYDLNLFLLALVLKRSQYPESTFNFKAEL